MRQTDHDYLKQIAQAADQLGYEGVLLPTGNSCEDAWVVASTLVPVTKRLKFLVAVRPAVMSPTLSARMATTDERYEVTDEFLTVWRSAISGQPTTFKGKHIHVEGAKVVYPSLQRPHPSLYWATPLPPWNSLPDEEAWQAANELIKYVDENTIARSQKALARLDSEGQRRMVALHRGDRTTLRSTPIFGRVSV